MISNSRRPALLNNRFNSQVNVILSALGFWVWVGKDLVYLVLPINIQSGRLLSIVALVLVLNFGADIFFKLRLEKFNSTLKLQKSLKIALIFFLYCLASGIISGYSAFTMFKLASLLLSIVISYFIADRTIKALHENIRLFFIVGLVLGMVSFYVAFQDISNYVQLNAIGLRAKKMAHLNIQDFFVILGIFSITFLLINKMSFWSVLLSFIGLVISVPIVTAMNSRMIPYVMGFVLVCLLFSLRRLKGDYRPTYKTALTFGLIVIMTIGLAGRSLKSDSRMLAVFEEGVVNSYKFDPRYISFSTALSNFSESPLYGIGFGKYTFQGVRSNINNNNMDSGAWPHNIILEILSELGVIGLIIIGVGFGRTIKTALFMPTPLNDRAFFFAFSNSLLIYILLTMQLTHNISYPLLWLGYFMTHNINRALALIDLRHNQNIYRQKI